MDTLIGIGLFIIGAALLVTSVMSIAGVTREWARAKPTIFNYLARNFMPYTYLSLGLLMVGITPHVIFDDPPVAVGLMTMACVVLGVPIGLISMIHWPLFLSPPWYRRWYRRGGRMGNNTPLWDSNEKPRTGPTS